MLQRQSGLSLIAVAIGMAALAGAAMFALYAMRHEGKGLPALPSSAKVTEAVHAVAAPASSAPMRKCTIDGKTVVSNTDCGESGKLIRIHDSKGIESPKAPPQPAPESDALRDKMIEKATR